MLGMATMAAASLAGSALQNKAAKETWEKQTEASLLNTANMQTGMNQQRREIENQATQQKRMTTMKAMQEEGRQQAAASSGGLGGSSVSRNLSSTRNNFARDMQSINTNLAQQNGQIDRQIDNAWDNHVTQTQASQPMPSLGADLLQAGTAAIGIGAHTGELNDAIDWAKALF